MLLYIRPASDVQASWLDGDFALVISLVVVVILGGLLAVLIGAAMQAESEAERTSESEPPSPTRARDDGREP